jgi:dynein heavy chain
VSEVIEQWLIVQNMWMYMEAVFSGGDIVKQLPQEAKRFQNIDKNYIKVSTGHLHVVYALTADQIHQLAAGM